MKYIFPKPASEDDFEDMVCDIFSRKFQNPNLQRFGRRGQGQKGLDILGGFTGQDFSEGNLAAIQCKNHPAGIKSRKLEQELEKDLKKVDKSGIQIKRFYFVTSAESNKDLIEFVLKINKERKKKGESLVTIHFWNFVQQEIFKHQDLVYKYFTRLLPSEKGLDTYIPDLKIKNRDTLIVKYDELIDNEALLKIRKSLEKIIETNLKTLKQSREYNLYIGVFSKENSIPDGLVDLNIDYSDLFKTEDNLKENFQNIASSLKGLSKILDNKIFSKQIVLYLETEISLAFLLGLFFRKYKFNVKIVFKDQVWTTSQNDLRYVDPQLVDKKPILKFPENDQGGIIVDVRNGAGLDIEPEVQQYLNSISNSPSTLLSYRVIGEKIQNNAHALSFAKGIADKILQLRMWNINHIHLFFAVPKPVAFLIAYSLNTLNSSLHMYFRNIDRTTYLKSYTITNNTF